MAVTAVIKANNSNLVLAQIAGKALEAMMANVVMPNLVTPAVDVDPQPREKGDTIKCSFEPTLVAQTKAENAENTYQAPDPTTTNIVLNQWREASVRVGELAQLFSVPNLGATYAKAIGKALARDMDSALLALYTSAGKLVGTFGTTLADSAILAARGQLSTREYPEEGRALVLHPEIYGEALAIEAYYDKSKIGTESALVKGALGMVRGFQVFEDPRVVTTTSSGGSRWHNLAFHKSALALAVAPMPVPQNTAAQVVTVSVADSAGRPTGVSLRLQVWYDPDEKCNKMSGDVLFGVKVLRSEALIEVRR